jgi:hypothetical protein
MCRIVYFEGVKGLEQVNWNATKAVGKFMIYETGEMNDFLGKGTSERIRAEHVKRGCQIQEITNHKKAPAFSSNANYVNNFYKVRYVDPKLLTISVDTMIYNDVVTFYHTGKKEPFCVEIHNEWLADMQKQLFRYTWNKAKPVKMVGEGGAWEI